MKKIFVLLGLFISLGADAQTFPTSDSLRAFIDKHIRNSAIQAFTNLRLNTALKGASRFTDSLANARVPLTRTLTINGTTLDLSANRSWTVTAGAHTHPQSDITNLTTDLAAKVDKNTSIVGATKTKITYDTKGLVLAGADATTTDIAEGTSLYFTNTRARDAISLTTTGTGAPTYLSGVFNIPNYQTQIDVKANTASPVFTGIVSSAQHDVIVDAIGGTSPAENGLNLINTTAAAVGAQQVSPAIRFSSFGWKTDVTAASRQVEYRIYSKPIQGTVNPSGELIFSHDVNNVGWADVMKLTTGGSLVLPQYTTAGYLKNSVSGVVSSLAAIPQADVTNLTTDLTAKANLAGGNTFNDQQTFNYTGFHLIKPHNATAANIGIRFNDFSNVGLGQLVQHVGTGHLTLETHPGAGVPEITLNYDNQNVLIGSAAAAASAQLAVTSTTKGFLPPRMTTVQRDAIVTPAAGLVVYDNTTNKFSGRGASAWGYFSLEGHTHAISDVVSLQAALDDKVVGPASATDNAITRFDLTTGKLLQNSSATLDDAGLLTTSSLSVTGASTLSGALTASGGIQTSATATTFSNFYSNTTTAVSTSLAELQLGGSTNISARIWERGSSTPTLAVGNSYASHIVGAQGITEAASGTHGLLSQLGIRSLNVTSGVGTVTDAATVYIEGASNATVTGRNDAFRVNSGTSYFGGKTSYDATNTATGTTGAQTINKPSGTVNIAAGQVSLVVTNNLVTTSSLVFLTWGTDATALAPSVNVAAGSFTITFNQSATAEVRIGFLVIN